MKNYQRIMIFGFPGGGKTTLAKQMGEALDIPVYHLDRIKQIENFEWKPMDEIRALVNEVINKDKWILDGYPTTEMMPACIERADTLIFIDFNRFLCMWRVTKRSIKHHGKCRPDVGDGCKDGFPPVYLCWVIWTFPKKYRYHFLDWMNVNDKTVFHFKKRKEVERFLEEL
jgi:adenylate kinase family enzyme